MPARYDLDLLEIFDMAGLAFDPADKEREVGRKISETLEQKHGLLGRLSGEDDQAELKIVIAFLQKFLDQYFDEENKKIIKPQEWKELVEKRTEAAKNALLEILQNRKERGGSSLTSSELKEYREEQRLSEKSAKAAAQEAGMTIVVIKPMAAYPRFPSQTEGISKGLDKLRHMQDPIPNAPNPKSVADIYDFAAYLENDQANAQHYRRKSTQELHGIFDRYAKKYSVASDILGKHLQGLTSRAKIIFESEENRKGYEAYLKLNSAEMVDLFGRLKKMLPREKKQSIFAESQIAKIAKVFGDYETALSIYNREAGLISSPYIPPVLKFFISCTFCDYLNEFQDFQEAQAVNACKNCGKVLLKSCSNCGAAYSRASSQCPDCGANPEQFDRLMVEAEKLLGDFDFSAALLKAKEAGIADPSKIERVNEFISRIGKEEEIIKLPLREIQSLISSRKLVKAAEMIKLKEPGLPENLVSSLRQEVNTGLNKARAEFSKLSTLPESARANKCLDILDICADFEQALHYLQNTPPAALTGFSARADHEGGRVLLAWSPSKERGVSYRLLRKQGQSLPVDARDGTVLAENAKDVHFSDSDLLPGVVYTYAVFAARHGVFSPAVGAAAICILPDVSNIRIQQQEKMILIGWDNPRNCRSVTVQRSAHKTKILLGETGQGGMTDADFEYGQIYRYHFQVNYAGSLKSQGVEREFTPTPLVKEFSIRGQLRPDQTYTVSWDIEEDEVDLRVTVNGSVAGVVKAGVGYADIVLERDRLYSIMVEALSGGQWLPSINTLSLSTHEGCQIDQEASKLEEGRASQNEQAIELHLKVKEGLLPDYVAGFYYAVRTRESDNKWPSSDEIGKSDDIRKISKKDYQDNHAEIVHRIYAGDETDYYVSLFTIVLVNGKEVVSEPSRQRLSRPLLAAVFWKVTRFPFKLDLRIEANRKMSRIPEMTLLSCDASQTVLHKDESHARHILSIPETELEHPLNIFSQSYDIRSVGKKELKNQNLFLFTRAKLASERYEVRWAEGFSNPF